MHASVIFSTLRARFGCAIYLENAIQTQRYILKLYFGDLIHVRLVQILQLYQLPNAILKKHLLRCISEISPT